MLTQYVIDGDALGPLHDLYHDLGNFVRQKSIEIAIESGSYDKDGVTVLILISHIKEAGEEARKLLIGMVKQAPEN